MGLAVEAAEPASAASPAAQPTAKRSAAFRSAASAAIRRSKFSLATGAVPGERIVGIRTPGEGIVIYPIFAKALEEFDSEPERWIDLTWDATGEDQRFPARIKVTIHNEVGALGPGRPGDRRFRRQYRRAADGDAGRAHAISSISTSSSKCTI